MNKTFGNARGSQNMNVNHYDQCPNINVDKTCQRGLYS